MSTDVSIFGGRRVQLPEGWGRQRLISFFGGANIDAHATPGEGARLTIVTVIGGALVAVPEGARVSLSGFSLFAGRRVDVESRVDGPEIRVSAYSVLGGVRITDGQTAGT
jgi:hypothetical protein